MTVSQTDIRVETHDIALLRCATPARRLKSTIVCLCRNR
jgi:hypothetical protein